MRIGEVFLRDNRDNPLNCPALESAQLTGWAKIN